MASATKYLVLSALIAGTYYILNDKIASTTVFDFIIKVTEYKLVKELIAINEWLEGAAFYLRSVPISLLDLCGSILVCKGYRKGLDTIKKSWFESLVTCTLMQFGGTTLTGLVLGQTPSWIVSHSAFPALLVAWWLTFFCPGDAFYSLVGNKEGKALVFIIGVGATISAGHAVTSWGLDKAAFNAFHVNHLRISQSALTCVLCGTLSGCGGGLLTDWLKMNNEKDAFTLTKTPSMFAPKMFKSTVALNRSFLCACLYYVMLNQHGYMPWSYTFTKEFGHLTVGLLQIANYLLSELGQGDVFQMTSSFILKELLLVTPIVDGTGGVAAAEEPAKSKNE